MIASDRDKNSSPAFRWNSLKVGHRTQWVHGQWDSGLISVRRRRSVWPWFWTSNQWVALPFDCFFPKGWKAWILRDRGAAAKKIRPWFKYKSWMRRDDNVTQNWPCRRNVEVFERRYSREGCITYWCNCKWTHWDHRFQQGTTIFIEIEYFRTVVLDQV